MDIPYKIFSSEFREISPASHILVSFGCGLLVDVCHSRLYIHEELCFKYPVLFSIREMLFPMHVKVSFSPPIGPLVYPGPLFMNQREQVLARLRPLPAFKLMREKLKGTAVFTTDSTWSPILPLSLSFPSAISYQIFQLFSGYNNGSVLFLSLRKE